MEQVDFIDSNINGEEEEEALAVTAAGSLESGLQGAAPTEVRVGHTAWGSARARTSRGPEHEKAGLLWCRVLLVGVDLPKNAGCGVQSCVPLPRLRWREGRQLRRQAPHGLWFLFFWDRQKPRKSPLQKAGLAAAEHDLTGRCVVPLSYPSIPLGPLIGSL